MQNRWVKDGSRVCGRTSHAASVLCLALRILHGSLYWGASASIWHPSFMDLVFENSEKLKFRASKNIYHNVVNDLFYMCANFQYEIRYTVSIAKMKKADLIA
jgi:hypothetical protein